MKIGVLALQGGFALHVEKLKELGADVIEVRTIVELAKVSAIILPGGESTTLLKLLEGDLFYALQARIRAGVPVLATCAGSILLAKEVLSPKQDSLAVLDVSIERNAYGRQAQSFISDKLTLTEHGMKQFSSVGLNIDCLEGVFIRAPRFKKIYGRARSIIELNGETVMVQQDHILAATFHPELVSGASVVHTYFLKEVQKQEAILSTQAVA